MSNWALGSSPAITASLELEDIEAVVEAERQACSISCVSPSASPCGVDFNLLNYITVLTMVDTKRSMFRGDVQSGVVRGGGQG